MTAQQRDGERYRAWLKVQEGRADECVGPTAVRRMAAEYEAQRPSYRYLTFGITRTEIAAALIEYRTFARKNPHDPLAAELLDVCRMVRLGLREERHVQREIAA
jgi:hypothetical protein